MAANLSQITINQNRNKKLRQLINQNNLSLCLLTSLNYITIDIYNLSPCQLIRELSLLLFTGPKNSLIFMNKDYLTDVIRRYSIKFLNTMSQSKDDSPFLMMLAPPACHSPFTPAPQHQKKFSNTTAPRHVFESGLKLSLYTF